MPSNRGPLQDTDPPHGSFRLALPQALSLSSSSAIISGPVWTCSLGLAHELAEAFGEFVLGS